MLGKYVVTLGNGRTGTRSYLKASFGINEIEPWGSVAGVNF